MNNYYESSSDLRLVHFQVKNVKHFYHPCSLYHNIEKAFHENKHITNPKIFSLKIKEGEKTIDLNSLLEKETTLEEKYNNVNKNPFVMDLIRNKKIDFLIREIKEEIDEGLVKDIFPSGNEKKNFQNKNKFLKEFYLTFEIIFKENKKSETDILICKNNEIFPKMLNLFKSNLNFNEKYALFNEKMENFSRKNIFFNFYKEALKKYEEFGIHQREEEKSEKRYNVKLTALISKKELSSYDDLKIFLEKNDPIYIHFVFNRDENNFKKLVEGTDYEKLQLSQFENSYCAELEDFFFGEFFGKIFYYHIKFSNGFKTMNEILNDYINEKIKIYFYPIGLHKNPDIRRKKITIIMKLFTGLEIKIEFSYKHASLVFSERYDSNLTAVYFQLSYPPKFFMYCGDTEKYEDPFLRFNWIRIPNILLISFLKENKIDEFERLHLLNNGVFKLLFNTSTYEGEANLNIFLETLEKNEILKSKNQFIQISEIQYKKDIHPFLSFSHFMNKSLSDNTTGNNADTIFEIKYQILSLVSNNKITKYDNLKHFLTELVPEKLEISPEIALQVLEYWNQSLKKRNPINPFETYKPFHFKTIFNSVFDKLAELSDLETFKNLEKEKIISKIRRATLTPSGLMFGAKEPEMSSKLLREFSNDIHKFLRVRIMDEDGKDVHNMPFVNEVFFKENLKNLLILHKKFIFLGFSASQLRAGGAWFLSEDFQINKEKVLNKLGDFSTRQAARIGQNFSSSIPFELDSIPLIEEDIKSEKHPKAMFTDGIGKISPDLMKRIVLQLSTSPIVPNISINLSNISVIQFRYGGAKGLLTVNYNLPKNTIVFRKSMVKYKNENTCNLEILDFNKYRSGFLNRQIILLLSTLKIPNQVFIELQNEYINNLEKIEGNESSIFNEDLMKSINPDYIDETNYLESITNLLREMSKFGLGIKDDPFVKGIIANIKQKSFYFLQKKSNILVPNSARLFGVLDEYSLLKSNEVFIKISEKNDEHFFIITGNVIVTRNPCLHPGDIKVLNAVASSEIQDKLGIFVNCIVFPQTSDIPLPIEISGGDLDGDLYFVSWDERLFPKITYKSMKYYEEDTKNLEIGKDYDENILNFFLDYLESENLGQIDNSHLAIADQSPSLAADDKCIKLAKLHSSAVDFAKTGYCPQLPKDLRAKSFPDFMEKSDKFNIYESETILGILYRDVIKCIENLHKGKNKDKNTDLYHIDLDLIYEGWENYIETVFKEQSLFQEKLEGILDLFGIQNEFEVYTGNFIKFYQKEKKVEHLQKKIANYILNLKNEFYNEKFLLNLGNIDDDDDEINDNFDESGEVQKIDIEQEKFKKASAHYLASYINLSHYQNKERNFEISSIFEKIQKKENCENLFFTLNNSKRKFIGMCWFICGKHLIDIKKEKYAPLPKQKNIGNDNNYIWKKEEVENDEEFLD